MEVRDLLGERLPDAREVAVLLIGGERVIVLEPFGVLVFKGLADIVFV